MLAGIAFGSSTMFQPLPAATRIIMKSKVKMKRINPRKTGYYKLFKILNRDTRLKTLMVNVVDNKSAHYKK